MSATCPECGARFRAPEGRAIACPTCGNPVMVATAAPQAVRNQATPKSAPAPAQPPAPGVPWGLAVGVLVVLAVAHYGLYRLVAADARSELAALEARQGGRHLPATKPPGEPPPANSERYGAWLEQKERYDDGRAYAEHESHRSWVARGLTLAYLVQVGITAFALYRVACSVRRRRLPR